MSRYIDFKTAVTSAFKDCFDFAVREFGTEGARCAVMFIIGITSRDFIAEAILRPLLRTNVYEFDGDFLRVIESPVLKPPNDELEAINRIAAGEALILTESKNGTFFTLTSAQFTHGRSVQEPTSDVTMRGAKGGFVEDAEKNCALLRKYVRTSDFKINAFNVGSVSKTQVLLCYVKGRADEKLISELQKRITSIKASVITDSANVAMLLGAKRQIPLPDFGSSEKIDKVASKLMAGRIGIIVDGSPFVLTLPFLFIEGLQSADDYLHTPIYATFIRVLRFFAFISAIFAPAILCTVINYNPKIIPPEFYGIIQDARKDIPLSFFWEILAILILFELLREVGVRMPRTVGDAVGIVGSIILGNTAVESGLVSSIGVITVAFSAVCAFITPAYMYVIVLSRLITLITSELFGVWGLVASAAGLLLLLCCKKSFGVRYTYPLIPFNARALQDGVFCSPKRTLGRRERLKK